VPVPSPQQGDYVPAAQDRMRGQSRPTQDHCRQPHLRRPDPPDLPRPQSLPLGSAPEVAGLSAGLQALVLYLQPQGLCGCALLSQARHPQSLDSPPHPLHPSALEALTYCVTWLIKQ